MLINGICVLNPTVNPEALGALPEQREGALVVTVESLGKSVSEEFPLKILANTEFATTWALGHACQLCANSRLSSTTIA